MLTEIPCVLCKRPAEPIGTVDFNRGCLHSLPTLGEGIDYNRCPACGMIFSPTMCSWSKSQFRDRVYNHNYRLVDPESASGERAQRNAKWLDETFGEANISHLDYGGGDGTLASILHDIGWDSTSYDPLDDEQPPRRRYDIITAFEVFEHAPDPVALTDELFALCKEVIVFSTVLNDAVQAPLDWWYLAPRNGHVALYSKRALDQLLRRGGFRVFSFGSILHIAIRNMPDWFEAATGKLG